MSILISFLYLYIVTFYILFFTVVCCNSTLFTFICFGIFCIHATLPWVWAPSFGFKHNSNWAHFMINAGAHPTSHILSVRWLLWRCNLYKTWWWLRVSGFLTCWVTHGSWRAAMCTLLLHYSARYRMISPPSETQCCIPLQLSWECWHKVERGSLFNNNSRKFWVLDLCQTEVRIANWSNFPL